MVLNLFLSRSVVWLCLSMALTACAQPSKAANKTKPAADNPATVSANSAEGDAVLLDMAAAFKRGDSKRLTQLLPKARGHVLEPWAAYWELRARMEQVSESEIRDFLTRYAHSYQEDRLRNDWLLLLGSRRDWTTLAEDRKSTRLNSSHSQQSRMPSSA